MAAPHSGLSAPGPIGIQSAMLLLPLLAWRWDRRSRAQQAISSGNKEAAH